MSSRERMTKVLGCLVLSVTAGAIILRLLQPAPLMDVTAFSLAVAFNPIGQVFETRVPVDRSRWQYIEIHQSGTTSGNAQTLAEACRQQALEPSAYHFVITNGRGAPDGRIQVSQQWTQQKNAPGRRLSRLESSPASTIRICLIGDFSQGPPGSVQLSQLETLLRTLQNRCQIPAENISLMGSTAAPQDQWRLFPLDKLRQALLSNSID